MFNLQKVLADVIVNTDEVEKIGTNILDTIVYIAKWAGWILGAFFILWGVVEYFTQDEGQRSTKKLIIKLFIAAILILVLVDFGAFLSMFGISVG